MIQSNFVRSSSMTLATPSSVSASLSRVCDAGSRCRFSRRLSRMSACGQLCHAVDDVNQIKDDASLGAQHQVEVAQSDIEINDDNFLRRHGQERHPMRPWT